MRETSKYKLNQWDKSDRIQMEDFNGDNLKVEEALGALAEADKAQRDEMVALTAALALKGNCQVYTTSYVGNGGSSDPKLTFPKPPLAVLVSGSRALGACVWKKDMFIVFSDATFCCDTTWSADGKVVTWAYANSERQMNASGVTYHVTAIAAAD